MSRLCYDVTVGVSTLTALADVAIPFIQCRDSDMMSSMLSPCFDVATLSVDVTTLILCHDIPHLML